VERELSHGAHCDCQPSGRRLARPRGFAYHLEYSKGVHGRVGILGLLPLIGPGSWRDLNPPSRRRQWGPNGTLKPGCAVEIVYNCLGLYLRWTSMRV
jgi:hypothetical protein